MPAGSDDQVDVAVGGAPVSASNPLPVTGTVAATGGITDAELRASAVPVSVAAGADATLGNTTDAAVDTDTTGTASGKLRGIVKLMVNLLSRWPAALAAGGGLKVEGVSGGVAQPTFLIDGAGATNKAAVDASGRQTVIPAIYTQAVVTDIGATANAFSHNTSAPTFFSSTTWAVSSGPVLSALRTPGTFKPQAAVAIATEATVWTPTSGKKFRLMGMTITTSVAGDVTFKDNTTGTTIAVVPCAANVPVSVNFGNGILSGAANRVLTATGPALSTLSGTIFGTEE